MQESKSHGTLTVLPQFQRQAANLLDVLASNSSLLSHKRSEYIWTPDRNSQSRTVHARRDGLLDQQPVKVSNGYLTCSRDSLHFRPLTSGVGCVIVLGQRG